MWAQNSVRAKGKERCAQPGEAVDWEQRWECCSKIVSLSLPAIPFPLGYK